MKFTVLPEKYSIYKFRNESSIPEWIFSADFYSVTRTKDEISVVAIQKDPAPADIVCNGDWRILKIEGHLDLSMVGVIAGVSAIFKEKKIPIFIISTYDTDYILIKQNDLNSGIEALEEQGYNFSISHRLKTKKQ